MFLYILVSLFFLSIAPKGLKREAKKYSELHLKGGFLFFIPLTKFGFSGLKILSPLFKKKRLWKKFWLTIFGSRGIFLLKGKADDYFNRKTNCHFESGGG